MNMHNGYVVIVHERFCSRDHFYGTTDMAGVPFPKDQKSFPRCSFRL